MAEIASGSSAAAGGWGACWSPRCRRPGLPPRRRHRGAGQPRSGPRSRRTRRDRRAGAQAGERRRGALRRRRRGDRFSAPAAGVEPRRISGGAPRKPLVIGTTGLDAEQRHALEAAAKTAAIVWAPNMSLGVNLLLGLVQEVAQRLGEDYDIEILEMHHRHKVDAPSGTALALGRAAAAGRGIDLAKHSQRVARRHHRPRGAAISASPRLRGGDEVGEHSVIFAGRGRAARAHPPRGERGASSPAARCARPCWAAGGRPGFTA